MGADRDEKDILRISWKDGTTTGKGRARRTSGRRNHKAVSGILLEESSIDAQPEAAHFPDLIMAYHDVVQNIGQYRFTPVFMTDEGSQEEAAFYLVPSVPEIAEAFFHMKRRNGIEKAQIAQMDPGKEDRILGHLPCRLEKGAVAADGQTDLRMGAEPFSVLIMVLIQKDMMVFKKGPHFSGQVIMNPFFFEIKGHFLKKGKHVWFPCIGK